MTENIEDRVRLTVEAIEGEDGAGRPILSGQPGSIDLSPEYARAAIEALRAYTVERMDWWLSTLLLCRHGDPDRPETKLDFDAPNQPTKEQVEQLLTKARRVVDALEVLYALAPWTYEDDDDEGDPEPAPDPAGVTDA